VFALVDVGKLTVYLLFQYYMSFSILRVFLAALAFVAAHPAPAEFIAVQGRIQSASGGLFAIGDTFTAIFDLSSNANPSLSPGRFALTAGPLQLYHGSTSYIVPNTYAMGYTSANVTNNTGNITGIDFNFESTTSVIRRFHGELYSLYPQNPQTTNSQGMILGNVPVSSWVSNPWAFIDTAGSSYNWMPIGYSLNSAPLIITQPNGGTYAAAGSFTLTVVAVSTSAITYEWYRDGAALSDFSNRTGSATATLTHTDIGTIGFDGSYTVRVTDAAGHSTLSSVATVIVNKADQTINFPAIADKLATDSPFSVTATASTGFAVTFAVVSGPATISGNIVTVTGAGAVTVRATQAGDLNYNSATSDRIFSVQKVPSTVTLGNLSQSYDGTARSASATTNPSGLAISFTYSGIPTAPVNAGSYAVVATVNDPVYSGSASDTLVVAKAPVTARADDKSRVFGSDNPTLSISYTGFLHGDTQAALTSEPTPSTTASITSPAGTYPITLSGGSALNYAITHQNGTLTVSAARISRSAPSISWFTPASIAAGTALSSTQLNATTDVAGSFSYSPTLGTVLSPGAHTLSVTFTPSDQTSYLTMTAQVMIVVKPATSRMVNISSRAYASTGDRVVIGGFVVSTGESKRVLIRAVGPSLSSQGLSAGELLADPIIQVHKGAEVIASNDDWRENGNAADISATAAQIGAAALGASDSKTSAILLTLQSGVYSFVASGKAGTSGIVLVEVYDADATAAGSTFVNISTRAYSTTGNSVTIGGFVVSGTAPKQLLIRAVGPTLATQGIPAVDVLADPMIELHDAGKGNVTIATNDDWNQAANAAAIVSTGARIGATPFATSDSKSSALLLTLQPGVYSFIASGKTNTSGIVLVEVYDAD
jgi:hypothetical protein